MAQKTIYTLTRKHFYWYGCTTETDVCTLAVSSDKAKLEQALEKYVRKHKFFPKEYYNRYKEWTDAQKDGDAAIECTASDLCVVTCTTDGAGDEEEYNFSIDQAPYLD